MIKVSSTHNAIRYEWNSLFFILCFLSNWNYDFGWHCFATCWSYLDVSYFFWVHVVWKEVPLIAQMLLLNVWKLGAIPLSLVSCIFFSWIYIQPIPIPKLDWIMLNFDSFFDSWHSKLTAGLATKLEYQFD